MAVVCLSFLLTALLLPALCTSSRILLMPVPHKSHVNFFAVTAKTLQDAGHDVRVFVPESRKQMVDRLNVSSITYPPVHGESLISSDDEFEKLVMAHGTNVLHLFHNFTAEANALCDNIHNNERLINQLENLHFDLVLVDGLDVIRCFYSIPYRLGVRYITLTARHDPWNAGLPAMPSVEPMLGLGQMFSAESSIWDRIKSTFTYVLAYNMMPLSVLDESIITRHCPSKPKVTFQELFSGSEMWLVKLETVCLDTPRVYGNHYQMIAGMGLEPAKPLPQDLEEFVQGSRTGFITLTLGSGLKNIPEGMLTKMLEAFAQIDQRVIMRHGGDVPENVPANVKMMSWIPQNDLLGHPKSRAFITHGGANGQLEALYHAVPILTIPIFGDQFYNAERVSAKGLGLYLDRNEFTSQELVAAIGKLTKERTIRDNIRRCSERFRSLPAAEDTILFWVEHIIRFGGDHLKPLSMHVPIWKMFMLDILALLFLCLLLFYTCTICLCRKLCTKFRNRTSSAKKKN